MSTFGSQHEPSRVFFFIFYILFIWRHTKRWDSSLLWGVTLLGREYHQRCLGRREGSVKLISLTLGLIHNALIFRMVCKPGINEPHVRLIIFCQNAPGSIRAEVGKGMPFERFGINLAFLNNSWRGWPDKSVRRVMNNEDDPMCIIRHVHIPLPDRS